ncbi:MAG: SPOR domain-containing protein [Methylobacterium sp.]|uniref:SPOR domain-containing protein n=1 Tax=Methylobacterium sp. TaxID=409 RepID=UPI0025E69AD2|nr:SPOR domain-containing protein [Methylobacterium sp.]MBX9931022.1 SPOR domain-containing protein [Methylobacterium sp.]
MTPNASRATVDFDAFERDLQQPVSKPAQQKADPLAELARIVGQDDPFRALLQARDARTANAGSPAGARIEPTFGDGASVQDDRRDHGHETYRDVHHDRPRSGSESGHQPSQTQSYEASYDPATETSPADAFNQYLASVEQGRYDAQGVGRDGHVEPDFADDATAYRNPGIEKPRQRSRLVSVGAGLGVLVLCVTGALTWRGLQSGSSAGGVPTIMADQAPLKIAPKTADGVEIPDQNKQIYDRNPKEGQIRIVNREEQPLDVSQAARAAPKPTDGGTTATPSTPQSASQGTLNESLGEPRRVRTVSVKPDTPVPPQREASADAADAAPPSVIPNMVMPGAGNDGTATTASLRPRAAKVPPPITTPAADAVAENRVAAAAVAPPAPVTPPAAKPKPPQKVAALPAEEPPQAPAVTSGPVGGYSVQLGVRASQAEAQAAFKQMQGKYGQLNGQAALIRQAEVNGKTIFRVRVGPLGKDEATSLCSQLQGAGGQCFVAKN